MGIRWAAQRPFAAINTYREENLIENSARLGRVMLARLEAMKANQPMIGDVRGCGLYGCIELVKNRVTKEPIDARLQEKIKPMLMARGLSTLVKGHIIFVGPPLIITEEELQAGLNSIEAVIMEIS